MTTPFKNYLKASKAHNVVLEVLIAAEDRVKGNYAAHTILHELFWDIEADFEEKWHEAMFSWMKPQA